MTSQESLRDKRPNQLESEVATVSGIQARVAAGSEAAW